MMIPKNLSLLLSVLAIAANSVCAAAPETKTLTLDPTQPENVTGKGDINYLKDLAAGVGWEFSPNKETTARLKDLGMRRIRCINVDNFKGRFGEDGKFVLQGEPGRLKAHLATCREIGAQPCVTMATSVPEELKLSANDTQERLAIMGQTPGGRSYWNGDWAKMRAYWKALFQYVIVDNKFDGASFEVGNEPNIDGPFPRLVEVVGKMGSRKLYGQYFQVYENAAQAAVEFEKEHPGVKVRLGGPTLAWPYSFIFGELNWTMEFLKDCSAKKLKLDFLGMHFYGNTASLNGEYETHYPSFQRMLEETREARDRYCPGVPLIFTEWGPSYHVNSTPWSVQVNAGNIGATWCAAFLKSIMENKVDSALYLVTTDLLQQPKPGQEAAGPYAANVWGWTSLFVNPQVFGTAWPKAPCHVFSMIRKLADNRIVIRGLGDGVDGIASMDPTGKKVTLMLWNFKARIPESEVVTEEGPAVDVRIAIDGGSKFFGNTGKVKMQTWLVSKDTSNALNEFEKTGKLTSASELQMVKSAESELPQVPELSFTLPPSSILFAEWTAN